MSANPRVRLTLVAVTVAAVVAVPTAIGAGEGDPVRGGVRNPSSDRSLELRGETQIIARNDTYGTRQSNKGSGGGAIYGCRSSAEAEPCVRANNLSRGKAFEFETDGNVAGTIEVGDPSATPFRTNGSGRVENLHADRVDATDFAPIFARMSADTDVTLVRMGPVRIAARCDVNANPTVSVNTTADSAIVHSIAHSTAGAQGDNRAANADFGQGETFVTGFGPSHSGTISYVDGRGAITVDLLTERTGNSCAIGGTARGGPNLG